MKTKRRIFETLAMLLALCFVFALVLRNGGTAMGYPAGSTPTPGMPHSGNYKVQLPGIELNYPLPYQFIKTKTGIHLSSGVQNYWGQGWQAQTRLTGGDSTQGVYPAIIVVLSRDLFNVTRDNTTPPCNINPIVSVTKQALFDYITAAANAGTRIVVRIYPSPGNFENILGYGSPHTLLTIPGARPFILYDNLSWLKANYCTSGIGSVLGGGENFFRSFEDIASEMIAIRNYTSSTRGWTPFAFISTNEPNSEWYPGDVYQTDLQSSDTWHNMDNYFAGIYSQVHPSPGANSNIRVLAVPMAPSDYAEEKNIVDCSFYSLSGGGLSYMSQTWMGSSNDGWAWNNYWTYGKTDDTADHSCASDHEHNFDAFRQDLKTLILARTKPALISEADLFSPCIGSQPEIPDKGDFTGNQNGASTQWSIKQFISQEQGANYVAIWNLTNGYSDIGSCPAKGNDEYAWHAAFRSYSTYERYWFNVWWLDTTQP